MKNFRRFPIIFCWLLLGQMVISFVAAGLYTLGLLGYRDIMIYSQHSLSEWLEAGAALTGITGIQLCIARTFSGMGVVLTSIFCLFSWGRIKLAALLWTVPVFAILLWYGYDHLVPDYRFMNDISPPYRHGLTWARYGIATAIELIFACAYWIPLRKWRLKNEH